uniref:SOWAHA-C winged helix-turn-helix domain-containing protein n=1 Tax=Takifugu rubripes TaxID=31033 RepID=A0A674NGS5_TAKRU
MAAGFTQDTVFHFLQSCGGSVKNADLLTHFRSFIRENPEQEKNRELFKRFVNSLATVQQIDGVSYVVLRKKFRGNVPGGGEQGSRVAPGKKREVFPGNGAQSLAGKAAKETGPTPVWTQPPSSDLRETGPTPVWTQPPSSDLRETGPTPGWTQPPSSDLRETGRTPGWTQPPSSDYITTQTQTEEHAWLVKGAAGAWPDIYSLFREDSSLLNRRDFISGFTVLHWIAKHGDHRVLNTLYGVEKAGVNFDINARSTSGHTPLHIATIHGHKNIIHLLVNKFGADMRLRDMAGKKAWQYLDCAMPLDVFQLLGAPPRVALKGAGEVGKIDVARQSSRRRRRHRFSSASPVHKQLANSKLLLHHVITCFPWVHMGSLLHKLFCTRCPQLGTFFYSRISLLLWC